MKTNSILRFWRARSKHELTLAIAFLLSAPFLHPIVNGDGVGYYAYVRSPLIDHNLSFSSDWQNPAEDLEKIFLVNHFVDNPVTKTGHLPNFYAVGPAILWSPFLFATHFVVLALRHLGWQVAADGHSWPYLAAMAVATALYGFAGLFFSFAVARKFVEERWAFWATLGIWLATSVPVYIYLLPAWSHAHSVFVTSLFLWYWLRTLGTRTERQWLVLGLLSGLMVDVYQLNGVFILAAAYEVLATYARLLSTSAERAKLLGGALRKHVLFALGSLIALAPTFIAHQLVFGSPFRVGPYTLRMWNWTSPAFAEVLFSTTHGLLVFAPILVLSFAGLFCLRKLESTLGNISILIALVFYWLIASFPWWSGAVGLGNRFFVSLSPIFVLGLASLFSWAVHFWGESRAALLRVIPITLLFILWNLGLVYQWQTRLMPRYGAVYWPELMYNQFRIVPGRALRDFRERFFLRANTSD
jgi:hypothetical protein